MFYIIGIGLNHNQITKEAIDAISLCKEIYIDDYTNIFSESTLQELEKIINKKIIPLKRNELETKQDFIKENSALLVIGNPFSATTHFTLLKDAKEKEIETKVIPGISIFSYKGYAGLYEYKFGKTISIVYPEVNFKPTSFYNTLLENINVGAHTMCLLDIKTNQNRLMSISEACFILEEIDNTEKNILKNKDCIALCGMGSNKPEIVSFKFNNYKNININKYPQTLIICGEINEFERDGINEYKQK